MCIRDSHVKEVMPIEEDTASVQEGCAAGVKVLVHGLVKRAEFNGRGGSTAAYHPDSDRWEVILDDLNPISNTNSERDIIHVRPHNLKKRFVPWSSHCLQLCGGAQMNFNGIYHRFKRPIRPRHISYKFCARSVSQMRGFCNFYLSGCPDLYEDCPVFWLGQPPEPRELFTCLMSARQTQPHMAWLPSGRCVTLESQPLEEEAEPSTRWNYDWHQVDIELDWHACVADFKFDGRVCEKDVPFCFQNDPTPIQDGFYYLYLFTWVEQSATDTDFRIADIWFEGIAEEEGLFGGCEPFSESGDNSELWSDDEDVGFVELEEGLEDV
eukprot:TRINITY_DN45273_c0_g1_i1.p1 TRINITY_DN45273_c0_g1~~TRINITY_DN45273_c0_g1_i1.p1  ORF type:complete len:324 (+),score=65.41 TRINITY_DN45273_c0_g1_i1:106-1077(+)